MMKMKRDGALMTVAASWSALLTASCAVLLAAADPDITGHIYTEAALDPQQTSAPAYLMPVEEPPGMPDQHWDAHTHTHLLPTQLHHSLVVTGHWRPAGPLSIMQAAAQTHLLSAEL